MQHRKVPAGKRRRILTLVILTGIGAGLVCWILLRPAPPTALCDDVSVRDRPGCTLTATTH